MTKLWRPLSAIQDNRNLIKSLFFFAENNIGPNKNVFLCHADFYTSIGIDRARLAEKYARKDEKMLFWPPPISLVWLPNKWETKQRRNK